MEPVSGDQRGTRFEQADLSEAIFDTVRLNDASFRLVDLRGARLQQAVMHDVVMRGVELSRVDIDGAIEQLVINGVDVAPLIEEELNRRYPDRAKMQPTDREGFLEAWDIIERRWEETVARARDLDPDLLHESVDGEWSFIQTLRHLVFASDAWINRAILGDPKPWNPLDLPFDTFRDLPGIPNDRDARPSLDEVLALRRDRMDTVREVLENLTEERLNSDTVPVTEPGYPEPISFPVRDCLSCILGEEWAHRDFAERDLAILTSREQPPAE